MEEGVGEEVGGGSGWWLVLVWADEKCEILMFWGWWLW